METQTNTRGKKEKAMPIQTQPEQEKLKGTFTAVLIVGGFILLSWFGVFGLFLERA
jgi:hypothetical protein